MEEVVVTSNNDNLSDSQLDYEVPKEVTSSIEDLSSDDISEALVVSHENHTVSDDLDADDYDFDNMFM